MTVTDPIADMLTRIRNAIMVHHDSVLVPASKIKLAVARILKEEGFISDYEVIKGKPHREIKIILRYLENKPAISGLKRVSKPGLRVYVQKRRSRGSTEASASPSFLRPRVSAPGRKPGARVRAANSCVMYGKPVLE